MESMSSCGGGSSVRKIALMSLLLLLLATPVFAAEQKASQQQAQDWNKLVKGQYTSKYKGDDSYDEKYVSISNWTLIDVDASPLKADDQEQIEKLNGEIEKERPKEEVAQKKVDDLKELARKSSDDNAKKDVESLLKKTEKDLEKVQKEIKGKEDQVKELAEKEYPQQVAVAVADVNFGGNTLGTMTKSEYVFVSPADNQQLEDSAGQQFAEVADFLKKNPIEAQQYHHETLGFGMLVLALGGWWVVNRKL